MSAPIDSLSLSDSQISAAVSTGQTESRNTVPAVPGIDSDICQFEGPALVRAMIEEVFPGRIAAVSSFGAEAAVLLALVAEVDLALPVIFLDTGKHFPETLTYRDRLAAQLGLRDVRTVMAGEADLRQIDPDGTLWRRDPDACCRLRKVRPLAGALLEFDAWFTGRKRIHGGTRSALPAIEKENGQVKINPLANWSAEQIEQAFNDRALPRHPLVAEGYLSIGCITCTQRTSACGQSRDGRWAGLEKTECGIHAGYWSGRE